LFLPYFSCLFTIRAISDQTAPVGLPLRDRKCPIMNLFYPKED
jgi:hypothetical protein